VKVTVAGETPLALAVKVLAPAVVPIDHDVTSAIPLESVVTVPGLAGEVDPPPEATVKITDSPDTGLPTESVISTLGRDATAQPTVAVWLWPPTIDISAAAPAPEGVTIADADVRPVFANVSR